MRNIILRTENLNVAAGAAGAIISAQSNVKDGINKPFTFTIESSNPAIQKIAECFSSYDPKLEYEELKVLETSQELTALDQWAAERMMTELSEGHGMVIDTAPVVNTLTYDRMMSAMLKLYFDLHNTATYWYPKLSKGICSEFTADAIVTSEEFIPIAKLWLEGFLEDSSKAVIKVIDDELDGIKYITNGVLALFAPPDHSLNCVIESYYEGFDSLAKATPIVVVAANNTYEGYDLRACTNWPGMIPAMLNEEQEYTIQKGRIWATRKKYNFDHHEFQKEMVKLNGVK